MILYFMTAVLCLQCLINIDYLRVESNKLELPKENAKKTTKTLVARKHNSTQKLAVTSM